MPHDTPLITTIVAGLVLAFIFGTLANRLRLPPLVGYLIAGVVVGPYTPGFVANAELATELSEIGVILLMFGVGLHFSLKDLVSVQAVAVPGALIRIALATAMGVGLGSIFGWPLAEGILFGLALSVASTVVVLKALQDRHLMDSDKGRITVGWVIVEDIAMVLALVLIPALGSVLGLGGTPQHDPFVDLIERYANVQLGTWGIVGVTVVKLAAFVGLMLVVGRRLIPMLLHFTAHTGSRELFRLAVLAIALGVAAGAAYLFGISLALGAFFAGMILSESELSQRAAQETLPLRDAFAVLFFVSVGMLFDPTILISDPLPVLGTVFIILVGKSVVSFLTLVLFRRPVGTALTVTAGLAQIGEFSLILATLGMSVGILSPEARDLIVAGAIISILLNPAFFWVAEALRPSLEARFGRPAPEPRLEPGEAPPPQPVVEEVLEPTKLAGHVVLIGYGRVGSVVAAGLKAAGRPFLVIEDADDRVAAARAAGFEVIVGNAASSKVLGLANLEGAQTAVVAIPNAFEAGQAVQQCRGHNANLFIIARSHSDEEEKYLLDLGANQVIMGEREIGLGMVEIITRDTTAVAAVVAASAVASALAPVTAAVTEHGPDIFAPAIEMAPAEPAATAITEVLESTPDSAAAPTPSMVHTAEVITPDFTAHRASVSQPAEQEPTPEADSMVTSTMETTLAEEPASSPSLAAVIEPAEPVATVTASEPEPFVMPEPALEEDRPDVVSALAEADILPRATTEPLAPVHDEVPADRPADELATASVAEEEQWPAWASEVAADAPSPMLSPISAPETAYGLPHSAAQEAAPLEVAAAEEAAWTTPIEEHAATAPAASETWPAWSSDPAAAEPSPMPSPTEALSAQDDFVPAPAASIASFEEEVTPQQSPAALGATIEPDVVPPVAEEQQAEPPSWPNPAPAIELPYAPAAEPAPERERTLPPVAAAPEEVFAPMTEPDSATAPDFGWTTPGIEPTERPAAPIENPGTPEEERNSAEASGGSWGSGITLGSTDPWAIGGSPAAPAAPPAPEPPAPAASEWDPTPAHGPSEPAASSPWAAEAVPAAGPATESTEDAQAAVEGAGETRRPRPFGPSSTAGSPFWRPSDDEKR